MIERCGLPYLMFVNGEIKGAPLSQVDGMAQLFEGQASSLKDKKW